MPSSSTDCRRRCINCRTALNVYAAADRVFCYACRATFAPLAATTTARRKPANRAESPHKRKAGEGEECFGKAARAAMIARMCDLAAEERPLFAGQEQEVEEGFSSNGPVHQT